MTVFLTTVAIYLSINIFFALLIWLAGHFRPECIGGVDFNADFLVNSFILSWTTFTTVVRLLLGRDLEVRPP